MKKFIFLICFLFFFLTLKAFAKNQKLQIVLDNNLITFEIYAGQTTIVKADKSIRILVKSLLKNKWTLNYQATPLYGPNNKTIPPNRILVKTLYTKTFVPLNIPQPFARGEGVSDKFADMGLIQFEYFPAGDETPGEYEGDIFSLEGGPTIHVKLIVKPPVKTPLSRIKVKHIKKKMAKIDIYPQNITFRVTGGEGFFTASSPLKIVVHACKPVILKLKASPLINANNQGVISPDKIWVKWDNNWVNLKKEVELLKCNKNQTCKLTLIFKLKVDWNTPAGEYNGKFIFTCIPAL